MMRAPHISRRAKIVLRIVTPAINIHKPSLLDDRTLVLQLMVELHRALRLYSVAPYANATGHMNWRERVSDACGTHICL